MMVGRGQPPKKPEDLRKAFDVRISQKEREVIERGRDIGAPGQSTSAFIREAALEKSERILNQEK